ncbi:type IV toxin-antitoxin system AbiEi family antitoxin domain-containing protein [Pseudonocardia sp. RS010]|uniref:type IV toxin-antitoxin system AbiEi family antitoxin domain-containing protein n=1 Tax=Pseudonocardia sp. RS010 TaxID=3385979 RepID=UPI00399F0A21
MDLDGLLRNQAGVLSHAQALRCGLAPRTVSRRVTDGRWIRVLPGVYRVASHRHGDEARVRAAWLWLGGNAVVSGPAAAYWHGMLDVAPPTVQVTIPRTEHRGPRPGVTVRRRTLDPADRARVRGIGITGPPLTVLETAVALDAGSAFLDRALQRHVRFAEVHRAYSRMIGSRGSRRAGRLLAAAADTAGSDAERLMVALLREAGVRGWVLGHAFGPWTIDLAFVDARVAVEFDGWAWHVDQVRFANDRRKGNALVGAGWTLLRFTWHDLTTTPALVVAQIERAVSAAA